jgi:F420H(2)-dependent quinone reductase
MRLWSFIAGTGIARNRMVTLKVTGRTSGEVHALPVMVIREGGQRYLASMLGDDVAWVRNVRAADGRATIRAGRRERVILVELPPVERPPLLKAFLRVAPGARPHIPVDKDAPVAAFEFVAARYPVFRVTPDRSSATLAPMETTQPRARDLDAHLDAIRSAPRDDARLELIVLRPAVDERTAVATAILDPVEGIVGDDWRRRGNRRTPDGSADPEDQLTIMSTRVLRAIEPDSSRWPLAGDQLYLDMDLGEENLPAGTRLAIGEAVVVVSAKPHTGCSKFAARFGADARAWINAPAARELRMRGINARIERGGTVRTGDLVRKL